MPSDNPVTDRSESAPAKSQLDSFLAEVKGWLRAAAEAARDASSSLSMPPPAASKLGTPPASCRPRCSAKSLLPAGSRCS